MTNPTDQPGGGRPVADLGVVGDPAATGGGQGSTTDVAKEQAASVKDTAVDAGRNVAETAKDEAANVAAEVKHQAKDLFGSVTSEFTSQAGTQQQNIAKAVSSLAKELSGMAEGSSESGPLTDLVKQAARRGDGLATWLENHEPRDVLTQVTAFGRRRPLAFLGACLLAGVVAGRFTRAAAASHSSGDSPQRELGSTGSQPAAVPQRAAEPYPSGTADSLPSGPPPTVPPVADDQLRPGGAAGGPVVDPPATAWGEPSTGRTGVDR